MVILILAIAVVVEPEGVGRILVKSMVEGREMPTVGVVARVEISEVPLVEVVSTETPESPSIAETPEGEVNGVNSIKPTSRVRTAPLVPNKCPPPQKIMFDAHDAPFT